MQTLNSRQTEPIQIHMGKHQNRMSNLKTTSPDNQKHQNEIIPQKFEILIPKIEQLEIHARTKLKIHTITLEKARNRTIGLQKVRYLQIREKIEGSVSDFHGPDPSKGGRLRKRKIKIPLLLLEDPRKPTDSKSRLRWELFSYIGNEIQVANQNAAVPDISNLIKKK